MSLSPNPMNPSARIASIMAVVLLLLGLAGISHAQYAWKNITINGGGYVPGVVYSPAAQNLIYARTDIGGFYRWDHAAGRWSALTDMFGPSQGNFAGGESVAPDPVDPDVVYAAAGFSGPGVVLRSSNQGASWAVHSTPISMGGNNDGRQAGERLAVDPHLTSKLYFGSRWQGLWVSDDSAANWSQVTSFPVLGDSGYGLSWVIFDPNGVSGSASATLYVGVMAMSSGNSNLYRSTDGGSLWSLVPGGPADMITTHACLGTDGFLWVVYNSGGYGPNGITTGQVWKLDTSSLAWANVTPPGGPGAGYGGYGGVSVDAQNAQHVVATSLDWWSGNDKIFSTSDGGSNWSLIKSSQTGWNSPPYSQFTNNGAVYTRGCGTTVDHGTMGWPSSIKIDPFNSANAIFGTGGGIWVSANITASVKPQGVTWTFLDRGIEEAVPLSIAPASKGGVFFSALGDIGGLRHTDLDVSPASGVYCNPFFSNTNDLDFAELNPDVVVRVGNSGSVTSDVAYSADNGQTWSPWGGASPGYDTENEMGSVAVSADGSHVVVAPYDGHGYPAYASSLGGSWTACAGLPSGAVLAADRADAAAFYATYPRWPWNATVTVYASMDYGASFNPVDTIPNSGWYQVMPRSVFGMAGEFWVTGLKLFRFTGGGSVKTQIANASDVNSVGFGKAAPGQTHPAVYLAGNSGGIRGYFRSDDGAGAAWTRINDDDHQYGGPGPVGGDEDIYGRVYIGAGGRGMFYGDMLPTTPTLTPTSACGLVTCTPTDTSTPAPTATPTQAPCVLPLNGCNSLAENGTWGGANASRGIVTSSPISGMPSEGSGCLAVTVTVGSTYNAGMFSLSGFTPASFAGFARLALDIHFPPEMIAGQGWAQMVLVGDSAANNLWFQNLSGDMPSVGVGLNTVRFNLNYPGTITGAMALSSVNFIFNAQNSTTGTLYVDNVRLENPCGSWTATPTQTATPTHTPSVTSSFTEMPSATPTPTITDTLAITSTPTLTITWTETSTFTPTESPTPTSSDTDTPIPTAAPSSPLVLFPNPLQDNSPVGFYYSADSSTDTIAVNLYTRAFRKVYEDGPSDAAAGQCFYSLDSDRINVLSNGLYYVAVVRRGGGRETREIMKLLIRR